MNYAAIKWRDIANGPGVRISLFVSGCRNHCKECFQPETWDFNYGKEFTKEIEDSIIKDAKENPFAVSGFTILGGEPFEEENQPTVSRLVERIKTELPNKSIWVYTGYLYEDLFESGRKYVKDITPNILKNIDVLVDGRFEKDLYDPILVFRGSLNQRIIDVQKSSKYNVMKVDISKYTMRDNRD